VEEWKGTPYESSGSVNSRGRSRSRSPQQSRQGRAPSASLKADELKRRSEELHALRQQLDAAASALVPKDQPKAHVPESDGRNNRDSSQAVQGLNQLSSLFDDVRADHEELRRMMETTSQLYGK